MHWVLPFCPWFCLHDFWFSQFVLSFFVIFKSGFFVYCVWLEFSLQVCPVKRWVKVVKILSQGYVLAWGCLRAFLFFCTAEYYGLCCRCVDEHLGLTVFHVLNQNLVYWIDATALSRIHAIYDYLFSSAALDSLTAVYAWQHWGWMGCVASILIFAMGILLIDRYDFSHQRAI